MSIRYQIAGNLARLTGMKKLFQLPRKELLEKGEQMNCKRQVHMPADQKARYTDRMIEGCHCLTMETRPQKSNWALLVLFGGGMIIGSDAGDLKLARDVGRRSGRDVWFPHYPLCTDHCIRDSARMVYETYREMLKAYAPKDIAVLGSSSGRRAGPGAVRCNNMQDERLLMQAIIVACSPGNCPANEEEYQKMAALNDRDFLVDVAFMDRIRDIMQHGETDVPLARLSFAHGDYTGAPLTHFYYGGDGVLPASAPYEAASYYRIARCPICAYCRKLGVKELMPLLCELDDVRIALQNGVLHRQKTIASGGAYCDYFITGDREAVHGKAK